VSAIGGSGLMHAGATGAAGAAGVPALAAFAQAMSSPGGGYCGQTCMDARNWGTSVITNIAGQLGTYLAGRLKGGSAYLPVFELFANMAGDFGSTLLAPYLSGPFGDLFSSWNPAQWDTAKFASDFHTQWDLLISSIKESRPQPVQLLGC